MHENGHPMARLSNYTNCTSYRCKVCPRQRSEKNRYVHLGINKKMTNFEGNTFSTVRAKKIPSMFKKVKDSWINTGKSSQLGQHGFGSLYSLSLSCSLHENILLQHRLRFTNWSLLNFSSTVATILSSFCLFAVATVKFIWLRWGEMFRMSLR